MSPTLTCLALALVGVDLGYRHAPDGGTEFIVHVNPATLQALQPGQLSEIYVPRAAWEKRPTHLSITPGNERLPGEVPDAASLPPAALPIGPAASVLSATATSPTTPFYVPPGRDPGSSRPPSASPKSSTAPVWSRLLPSNSASSRAASSGADKWLAPLGANGGNSAQPERPWLGMCLLVIALLASNVYVGWLFWDARQRYRGLLAQTFSLGQQAAEA